MKGSDMDCGMIEMPQIYVLEMVADWQGASMAYTGSLDMRDWLHKGLPKISAHSQTVQFLRETLSELGYSDIVREVQFKSEVE